MPVRGAGLGEAAGPLALSRASLASLMARARPWIEQALPALVSLVIFGAAIEVLRFELRSLDWQVLARDVVGTPRARLLVVLLLTACNYLVLTGYDILAFQYVGKIIALRRIAWAAFLAYAISHSVGFAALSGASVRFRFYSRWGVTAAELTRIVFSYSVTFWIGLFALGGLSFVVSPLKGLETLPGHELIHPIGWLLMATVAAYLAATAVRRQPIRIGALAVPLPAPRVALSQLVLSITDWLLAGAVLYVLLPAGRPPFLTFLGSFLVAILVGMVSHVPGGLGVFEGLMVLLMGPWLSAAALLPAFVVYRAVYYLLPFLVALMALAADEVHQRRAHVARVSTWLGRLSRRLTPRALAAFTFFAGVVLLMSGATPASPGRLDLLGRILPLGVIETSHFIGSIAGAGLLVLSQGLVRRLDAAYYLSSLLIVVGMAASLLKGFDVEEAVLLFAVLVALRSARPAFDRRAAFFETRFSPAWMAALVGAVGASVWLGFFAFEHVDYAADLWWRFELSGDASRFLRGSVGAAVVVLLAGLARLIGHPPPEVPPPCERDLNDAACAIENQTSTSANLVFLRDKGLLFNEARDAFVMYAVQGSTWVAMGDPSGLRLRRAT